MGSRILTVTLAYPPFRGKSDHMRIVNTTLLLPLLLLFPAPAEAQDTGDAAIDLQDAERARAQQLYLAHCGRCHGVLGLGGEGPELARAVLARAPSQEDLERIIRQGIAGTGMPGARSTILPDREASLVARYVQVLGAQAAAAGAGAVVTGDADRGNDLFWTTGDCASCHIVAGRGTAVGPELTAVGLRRGPDYLREALRAPAAKLPVSRSGDRSGFLEYLPVRAVTRAGDIYNGMRVNEDAFTIQLMTVSGVFVSLRKSEIAEFEKRVGHSLMPVAGNLTEDDVEDLVAYLMTLGIGP